jgi:hypothetical protein
MRSIEIAEALENGAKGSAIDLNNAHNVPILKSDCVNAVSYAVNFAVNGCLCDDDERLCAKASGAVLSQTSQHDADHGEEDPGFLTAREHFVVLGQPAPGGEPGECSLHDPTPFEHMEPTRADLFPIHLNPFRHPHTGDAVTFDAPRSRPAIRG